MLTVITGPPCSGKSTYLREHAQPGEIVIDFDALTQALGSPNPHDHSDPIRAVTIDMRRAAIRSAIQQHERGATVWIVDCNPESRMAGAEVVSLSADPAELHRRASAERPAMWHELIDRHLTKRPPRSRYAGSRAW